MIFKLMFYRKCLGNFRPEKIGAHPKRTVRGASPTPSMFSTYSFDDDGNARRKHALRRRKQNDFEDEFFDSKSFFQSKFFFGTIFQV